MNLRSKLIIAFLFLSVLPVTFLGSVIYANSRDVIENDNLRDLLHTAEAKEGELLEYIDSKKGRTTNFASDGYIAEQVALLSQIKDQGELRNLSLPLVEHLRNNKQPLDADIYEIYVIDLTGRVVGNTERDEVGKMESDESFFIQGKVQTYMANIQPYAHTNQRQLQSLIISTPIFNRMTNQKIGVLANRFMLGEIQNILKGTRNIALGSQNVAIPLVVEPTIFLVNDKGNAVEANKDGLATNQLLTTEPVQACLSNSLEINKDWINGSGKHVYGASMCPQNKGDMRWVLVVEQDEKIVLAPITHFRNFFILVSLLIFVAVVLIIFLISKRISDPIVKLTESANKISNGKLDMIIPKIGSHDEIGQLTKSISLMTNSLISSLKEVERLFRVIPDSIFVLNADGTIKSANPAGIKLTEETDKKLNGQPLCSLLDDCDINDEGECEMIVMLKKKPFHDLRRHLITKSKKGISVAISGLPLKETDGSISGFLFVVKDLREFQRYAKERVDSITPILHNVSLGDFSRKVEMPEEEDEFTDLLVATDLMARNLHEMIEENDKKNELLQKSKNELTVAKKATDEERDKLKSIISNMAEGLLAINKNGNITLLNNAVLSMFPWVSALGEPFHLAADNANTKMVGLDGNEIKKDQWPIYRAMGSGKKESERIGYIFGKKETLWLDSIASPIYSKNELVGAVSVYRDVTKMQEVDKMKGEFISLASHQLQTPLTSIKWIMEKGLSRKKEMKGWQKEFFSDALSSTDRMISLVKELLNVSRLEAGVVQVESQEVDVGDFIERIVRETSAMTKKRHQKNIFKKPKNKIIASFDPMLIEQVISNLISNASHYSEPKTRIQVFLKKTKHYIEIAVKDEGMGISEKDQKKLFGKFFRSVEATKRSTTGSGLGLYLINKILSACKGKIKVESKLGKGTIFTVQLPIKGPVNHVAKKALHKA